MESRSPSRWARPSARSPEASFLLRELGHGAVTSIRVDVAVGVNLDAVRNLEQSLSHERNTRPFRSDDDDGIGFGTRWRKKTDPSRPMAAAEIRRVSTPADLNLDDHFSRD